MSQVTKRALEASLKHLLLQKPLNKITINDIAEDCGINRMTFYYHFKDIYDLVEWCCEEDAGVELRQIEARQQSPDHPILWNVPETDYLKFYLFQVV